MENAWTAMWGRLDEWVDTLITNLPNILLAIVVFVLFYWAAYLAQKLLRRNLGRFVSQDSVSMLVSRGTFLIIVALGFLLALGILNLDTVLKSVLAGAGVAGLAIGLALQGTLTNTFSGVFLAVKDILKTGDWIESNGYMGHVEKITLRHVFIREPDNNLVALPNRLVLENPFKNYGLTSEIRVILHCGVSYSDDLANVRNVATKSIRDHFGVEDQSHVELFFEEFGSSSINFILRFRVQAVDKLTMLEVKSQAIEVLKSEFDANGITIPFPIRTLEFNNAPELITGNRSGNRGEKESRGG